MATPLTHFEKWNYQIQYQIFSRLDKNTEQTQKLRFPAFLAFGASNLAHLTTGTASVAELAIHGLGLVLTSYPSSEWSLRGRALLKRIPLRLVGLVIAFPVASIMNAVIIASEPKLYILSNSEHIKVNQRHLEAGTIGTPAYETDSQRVRGIAKGKLIEWQEEIED